MSDPLFQEADASDFDDSLISTTLATQKEAALSKLTAKLTALTKAAHDGQPVSDPQVTRIREKIAALERPAAVGVVDLPVGLDVYSQAPVVSDRNSESVQVSDTVTVPVGVWQRLFDHQKQALKWLCDLHAGNTGGILADEMGLGKTVEIAAFLTALRASNYTFGPTLVLCPATIVEHWKETLQAWGEANVCVFSADSTRRATLHEVKKSNGVLVTNYELLYTHESVLTSVHWFYVVLDEGHKIRNPVSKVTLSCKRLRTSHRLLLSGTPIQNNLTEFWSLVDFVNPGLLGSLETFEKEIAGPILKAGYVTADVRTAELGYQCACQLRDLISPYILRRTKKELKLTLGLPEKEEKLLLCEMTQEQYDCYVGYLDKYTKAITCKKDCFACIRDLRHITNHPGILAGWKQKEVGREVGGSFRVSGKLAVLEELIKNWAVEGHKTAVFSQSKRMLTICETLIAALHLSYARIDGDMAVCARLPILKAFNHTPEYRVILLTTKVGGLGVSLTGASRLVLLDPDWNPMTDIQAKERVMRIGQDKDVVVYRFVTRGTIEEKVYRRQVFKVFLANRILHNPEQKKFFSSKDISELFEYPPRPKHLGDFLEEDTPRKVAKTDESLILASLLDSDGVKREDLSQSALSNPSNTVEMKRIEAHAQYLAQKAASTLVKSRPRFVHPRALPQPVVVRFGTADAQNILMRVKEGQCRKQELREKTTSSEEIAVKRLHEFLVEKEGRATSSEVVAFINAKLHGFDAYLVRAVLKAIATLKDGKWTLRTQLRD